MQCYTELTPPTAVTHSLSLPFISASSNNLIVAKTSLLQIFTFKVISSEAIPENQTAKSGENGGSGNDHALDTSFKGSESFLVQTNRSNNIKLVLVAEYTLSGTITSMVRVKTLTSKSGGEALLIGFKDAKLSLIEWDPERMSLSTISIHYYEQEELQGSPWAPALSESVNYLAADPGSRCAALKFGVRNLAILPFRQGDEDVIMDDDWDEELDGPRPTNKTALKNQSDANDKSGTPYSSSFVLRLSALDPNIIHPVHLGFLYEYREPTFGILSSSTSPSAALLQQRRDHLTYMVFTLDLHQRASTTILSVSGLPYDLSKVVPLAAPIGGALLVGGNELIHIDQAGKANGVAVNMFAKQSTSFGLADQSDLDLRLEGCLIEQLSIANGEMLLVLHSGALAILSFRMDGRSVSGLDIRKVSEDVGGSVFIGAAASASLIGTNALFLGSETADSVVLGWSRKTNQISKRRSRIELPDGDDATLLEDEEMEDDDDDADDDLYGESPAVTQPTSNGSSKVDLANSKAGDYSFRIHDNLINIAPMIDIAFGKASFFSTEEERLNAEGVTSDLEIVVATGKDEAGSLAILHGSVQPKIIGRFEFPEARGIWTMSVKRPTVKGLPVDKENGAVSGDYGADAQYDRLMIVSQSKEDSEESGVYALTDTGFEALTGTEFEPAAGPTIEAGLLGNGMRLVQILRSEVRSYDGDLGLAQIIPMFDDDTGADPKIVSASLADPYLLLIRDDASVYVAQCDDDNELEELEREDDTLLSTKWLTGCLYLDSTGAFASEKSEKASKGSVMMFLLSANGALHIYTLPDLSKAVYVAEGLCFVPPVLSADYAARRSAARETLTEIIVADLGDSVSKSPYLILRPSNDDLTIYEPFRTNVSDPKTLLKSRLHFVKISNPSLAEHPTVASDDNAEDTQASMDNPMRAIANLGGFSTVFMPGGSPSFIFKSSKSNPKVIRLKGSGVRGMSSFHTAGCDRGFIHADVEGIARVSQLPPDTTFDLGMALQKIPFGQAVHAVSYQPSMETYVIGTSIPVSFSLPKDDEVKRDDHRWIWQKEDIHFKPTVEQSFLKLINPITWSTIDTVELDPCEMIMCMKALNLEVSETTNERRQLITVGTAISKGEDLPIKGRIYVFDVVSVVPEPDRPETNKKLKLIAKEDIPRGAVTSVSEIGTQGFMLVAQGQKCMVRGLKDDGTILPVAFMDMNCYVTSAKELRATGLCVMADAVKGVWFAGYSEEPYRMILFGKSDGDMEVLSADLLPDGKDLYLAVADVEGGLHILQYDPDHPKSLQGHLLLHRTTFHLGGHLPTTMTLLPRTSPATTLPLTPDAMDIAADDTLPINSLLLTSNTGVLSVLTPLSEIQYRKLSTLASVLTNTLHHPCGLNPKAYRIGGQNEGAAIGGRTVVDGSLLMRWNELGSQRRAEVAGRVGVDSEEVREDLSWLRGGLGYL